MFTTQGLSSHDKKAIVATIVFFIVVVLSIFGCIALAGTALVGYVV